ncbi:MAG: hypothetical protein J5873_00960 [Bacteroidales bacterium]|nr:hypothetical protein [Bacteroidales bacterium]
MIVLLVTTSPNSVRNVLSNMTGVELLTIECTPPLEITKRKLAKFITSTPIDLIITYRCPLIIPQSIYSRVTIGAFNIHPSLLPMYAGLNPWEAMFEAGETGGGVTIHRLNPTPDTGKIVMQESFRFPNPLDINTARDESDRLAAKMIVILMEKLLNQKNAKMNHTPGSGFHS